jgi:hypothetical protein
MTIDAVTSRWHDRFSEAIRFVVAPLVLFFSGFFTTDFVLSGMYTWPRTSRVFVLTVTIVVLAYEFVYKEQRRHPVSAVDPRRLKALLYSCVVPYGVGVVALLVLVRLVS